MRGSASQAHEYRANLTALPLIGSIRLADFLLPLSLKFLAVIGKCIYLRIREILVQGSNDLLDCITALACKLLADHLLNLGLKLLPRNKSPITLGTIALLRENAPVSRER